MMRPADIAQLTGLSAQSVRRAIRSGELPARKYHGYKGNKGSLHVMEQDYEEWVSDNFQPVTKVNK